MDMENLQKQKVDPELAHFIQQETERQKFQAHVGALADSCWDMCMTGTPGPKLDAKYQTCLENCVNRHIDASTFIVRRLQDMGDKITSGKGF